MEPGEQDRYRRATKACRPRSGHRWCSRCRRGAFQGGRWINFKFVCHDCIEEKEPTAA